MPVYPRIDHSINAQLVHMIANDFYDGRLDLSERNIALDSEWSKLPEVKCMEQLRASGASDRTVRLFITFIAAMERARDSTRLWHAGIKLFESHPELFNPAYVSDIPFSVLFSLLSNSKVSQRHRPDTDAWRIIAGSLMSGKSPVRRVIDDGVGDAEELLKDLRSRDHTGRNRFPMLRGQKIGPMWVRMIAVPGGAKIDRMDIIPVAVDVQVRRASENLGVVDTRGLPLREAKPIIQRAWQKAVVAANIGGPSGIAGTCAALDPVLWFFGKHGCSYCEKIGQKVPISRACDYCQLSIPTQS